MQQIHLVENVAHNAGEQFFFCDRKKLFIRFPWLHRFSLSARLDSALPIGRLYSLNTFRLTTRTVTIL